METSQLKDYAPEVRKQFIEAVANKAAVYGLLPDELIAVLKPGSAYLELIAVLKPGSAYLDAQG